MAHPIFHFSIILLLSMLIQGPWLFNKINDNTNVSDAITRFLIISYGFAVFSIIPNILGHLGAPDPFWTGWWMNIFIFHHIIDRIKNGGLLIGELLYLACFGVQYAILLITLLKLRQKTH